MAQIKTSLTLDPKAVKDCKRIAFESDISFSKFMRDLMKKAIKTDQRSKQRARITL